MFLWCFPSKDFFQPYNYRGLQYTGPVVSESAPVVVAQHRPGLVQENKTLLEAVDQGGISPSRDLTSAVLRRALC